MHTILVYKKGDFLQYPEAAKTDKVKIGITNVHLFYNMLTIRTLLNVNGPPFLLSMIPVAYAIPKS
jgi:hypothetical protein